MQSQLDQDPDNQRKKSKINKSITENAGLKVDFVDCGHVGGLVSSPLPLIHPPSHKLRLFHTIKLPRCENFRYLKEGTLKKLKTSLTRRS